MHRHSPSPSLYRSARATEVRDLEMPPRRQRQNRRNGLLLYTISDGGEVTDGARIQYRCEDAFKRKFRRAKPRWTQASERNKQLTSACVQCVQCVQSSAHMPRQRRKKGSKKLGIRNRVRPREKREKSRDTPRLERRCRQAAGAWACISQAEASENRQSTRMGVKKKVCTEGNTMHLSLSLSLSCTLSLALGCPRSMATLYHANASIAMPVG